jgi:hypothetical protein
VIWCFAAHQANILGGGKSPVGAGSLGVHAPLGDYLPVEVGHLLQIPDILQRTGPRLPAVMVFWSSTTGATFLGVSFSFFLAIVLSPFMLFNRLLKNAHLLRCAHPSSLQRTKKYASFLLILRALHLNVFDQPEKTTFLTTC